MLFRSDAVYYEGEQAYVFCAEDGIARKTLVETGLYNDDKIEDVYKRQMSIWA